MQPEQVELNPATEALHNAVEAVEEAMNMLEQVPDLHGKDCVAVEIMYRRLSEMPDLLNAMISQRED
ncbi:MAG: hypothetical protein AAF727_06170 [Pseudomonadota bacterium]